MKFLLKWFLFFFGIASLIGLFSDFYWAFDLFNHFRFHLFLLSILLIVISFFSANRNYIIPLLFLLFLNGFLFLLPLYQTHQTLPLFFNHNNKKLKIISANVYRYNTNYSKTIDLIMKNAPDIVALIETDKNWIKGVRSIEKIYPYFVKEPRDDKFGLAIYSKLPFQVRIEEIGFYQLPLAILDFKNFKLIIAHPIAPVSPLRMYDNKQYIKMIAQIVKRSKKSVIVAGDLNATFWSDSIKPLFNSGLERMNSLKSQHTWPTHLPFLGIQIDHFLAKGIKKTHFQVLSDIGSDHYPIQGMIETIDSPE